MTHFSSFLPSFLSIATVFLICLWNFFNCWGLSVVYSLCVFVVDHACSVENESLCTNMQQSSPGYLDHFLHRAMLWYNHKHRWYRIINTNIYLTGYSKGHFLSSHSIVVSIFHQFTMVDITASSSSPSLALKLFHLSIHLWLCCLCFIQLWLSLVIDFCHLHIKDKVEYKNIL